MRCITDSEFGQWLSGFGVQLDQNSNPVFSEDKSRFILLAFLPKREPSRLYHFAAWLTQWLPNGRGRALWLKHWMAVAEQEVLFERLRHGSEKECPIGLAPGHLFASNARGDFNERTSMEVGEDGILLGLILLVMLFDWKAYLFAENHGEYVYLADECVAFSSPSRQKLETLAIELSNLDCEVSWIKPA